MNKNQRFKLGGEMNPSTYPTHKRPSDRFIRRLFELWHTTGNRAHGDGPVDVEEILSYPHNKKELIALLSLYGRYSTWQDHDFDTTHAVYINSRQHPISHVFINPKNGFRFGGLKSRPWHNEWLVLAVLLHDVMRKAGHN